MSDDIQTITKDEIKIPSMYTVVFLNDDYTPMDFVVRVLVSIFGLDLNAATYAMLTIHRSGKAKVGRYTYEVAEHKQVLTMDVAKKNMHPLLLSIEPI